MNSILNLRRKKGANAKEKQLIPLNFIIDNEYNLNWFTKPIQIIQYTDFKNQTYEEMIAKGFQPKYKTKEKQTTRIELVFFFV